MKYTSCVECKRLIPAQRIYVGNRGVDATSAITVGPASYSEIDGLVYCLACTKIMIAKYGLAEEIQEPVLYGE